MDAPPRRDRTRASLDELAHLERAHHEICTALTVLQSNVALVRVELRGRPVPVPPVALEHHLDELQMGLDRLRALATEIRAWHAATVLAPQDEI